MSRSTSVIAAIAAAMMLPASVPARSPLASPALGGVPTRSVVTCPAPVPRDRPVASATPLVGASMSTDTSAATLVLWGGTWTPMPAAPITARAGAATDIAPDPDGRIYIWGGRASDGTLLDDGAVYIASAQAWERLPDSGLAPRESFGFDSDGRGITVWGGVDAQGQPLGDGARLILSDDDRTMSWTPLPGAPLTPGPASMSGDDNITYVVTPGTEVGGPPRFAVLDAASGRLDWDDPSSPDVRHHGRFPSPPLQAGVAYEVAAADETALLVAYLSDGTAQASWFTGAWPGHWSDPVSVPLPLTDGCPALGTTRDAWIRTAADGTTQGWVTTVNEGGRFRAIIPPPAGTSTGGMLVWASGRLIVADDLLGYETDAKRWTILPGLPDGPRTGVSAAWGNGHLYVWGGTAADGTVLDSGWVFTPSAADGAYPLASHPEGDCGGEGDPSSARIRAEESDPALVWLELRGERLEASWPEGTTVRFTDTGARILDAEGDVIARAGQRLSDTSLTGCMTGDIIFLY